MISRKERIMEWYSEQSVYEPAETILLILFAYLVPLPMDRYALVLYHPEKTFLCPHLTANPTHSGSLLDLLAGWHGHDVGQDPKEPIIFPRTVTM